MVKGVTPRKSDEGQVASQAGSQRFWSADVSLFWDEILPRVRELRRIAGAPAGEAIWFRGQRDAEWPLRSRLHRVIAEKLELAGGDPREDGPKFLSRVGASLYHQFRNEAWSTLAPDQRDPWELVFMMQHHGVPTTLLDWSSSFAAALFFAQWKRNPEDTAVLFIMLPEKMNVFLHDRPGLVLVPSANFQTDFNLHPYHPAALTDDAALDPVAVSPHFAHPRMKAQRSTFILCGTSFEPLEEQSGVAIERIQLPPETYEDVQEFLALAGAEPSSLFPDLGGIAEEINARPL
jgi:hypothetical protein